MTALVRAVLTLLRQSLLLRLQTKLSVVMVSRFLWHVMALPVEFFTQRHAGDIRNRVGANEQIAPAAFERHRRQCAQPDIDRLLRRRHGDLRSRR